MKWRFCCLIPLSLSRKIGTGCQPERSQSSGLGLKGMNYAWALRGSYETSFDGEVLCGCGLLLGGLYLPTDCMMSRSIGAAKSGLRWINMERTTTARPRVSSSYSSSTAAQSRHLGHHKETKQDTSSIELKDFYVIKTKSLGLINSSTCQTWWSAVHRWIPPGRGQTCWLCLVLRAGWSLWGLQRQIK